MFNFKIIIDAFLERYSCFKTVEKENCYHIVGLYHMKDISYNDIMIEDYFDLKIIINKNLNILPIVYEKRRIKEFYHKFVDGSLCLGITMEISLFMKKNKYNLLLFFEQFVVPYLYSYVYYEMFGKMPFGERSHGINGYLEYFQDVFNLNTNERIREFINDLKKNKKYRGHHLCLCKSGLKIRDCHKDVMYYYYNEKNDAALDCTRKYLEGD